MVGASKVTRPRVSNLERAYLLILLVIFGGIVLHAPLSVGLGTLLPDYSLLIKSWKEILIIIACVIALIILRHKRRIAILKEPLMIGIGIYLAIHLLCLVLLGGEASSVAAGLAIDVRYILFFALIFIAMRLYPTYKPLFIKVGIAGALTVMTFALLQVFVLPADVLKYIGYSTSTIVPYLTVDQNTDFIRINSTLRGPNPLGAYALIVLTLLAAFWARGRHGALKRPMGIVTLLGIGGLVALWASYSRSALLGALVAIAVVVIAVHYKKIGRKLLIGGFVAVIVTIGILAAAVNTNYVSTVLLHEDPAEGNNLNSNQGHINSLQDGLRRLVVQPFGAGIGSTGSASLYTENPLIIENQYLFIAHEVGWLGIAFFVMIFIGILARLWQRRSDWLSLGVFASGIGLAIIGLLLPVWADDTIAIIWWGLAGLAIGDRR
ncbi:hypothetical protein BH10PAT4_BH10PAT4_4950 [soil metagenome]